MIDETAAQQITREMFDAMAKRGERCFSYMAIHGASWDSLVGQALGRDPEWPRTKAMVLNLFGYPVVVDDTLPRDVLEMRDANDRLVARIENLGEP